MLRRLLLLALALAVSAPLAVVAPLAATEATTLRMAYDADPTSLDPHEQLASATAPAFPSHLRSVAALPPTPHARAAAATSWEKTDEHTTRFHCTSTRGGCSRPRTWSGPSIA